MTRLAGLTSKSRRARGIPLVVGLVGMLVAAAVWFAPPAPALFLVTTSPAIGDGVVGATVNGAFGVSNSSTDPEDDFPTQINAMDLYPSCNAPGGFTAVDCANGTPEVGVYQLSATGTGQTSVPPNATCTGTWTMSEASPGRWRFIPPGGEGTLLIVSGEVCVVNFTALILRVPTFDVLPAPGVQTFNATGVQPTLQSNPPQFFPRRGDFSNSTVGRAAPTITTQATPTVTIGSPISDTATVTGVPAPSAQPTGTVTFSAFGPGDPTCVGAPAFGPVVIPLGAGPPFTPNSGDFTPTVVGTYEWVATYSGDANYNSITSPCGAPNESSVVAPAVATVTTQATQNVTVGGSISDVATVTGAPAPVPIPSGTVTFTLFGPNNAACAGAPIFTSGPIAIAGGPPRTATSGSFQTTAPGDYRWIASYSGDANYNAVTSICNDANETSVVDAAVATITTNATQNAPLGSPISDTATVTGAPAPAPTPTGTVVFTLFGPNDPTCAGAPVFTSAAMPLAGGPPPTANSGPFTPTTPGSYLWIAAYSGDVAYDPVTSGCGDPNEESTIAPPPISISTQAVTGVPLGTAIRDVATVTGAALPVPAPTGTVTFTLFGPGDTLSAGPVIFTSANRPLGGGPPPIATSADFTPSAAGSYNWVAVYSGDAIYASATSPCGAPNETSVIGPGTPAIVTNAVTPVVLGSPISDTATVTGAPAPAAAPTGTVTFTLFNNPTCTGAAIFNSGPIPLAGGPPPTANSGDFTPSATGSYNWVAVYSGDGNYTSVASPCGAPNETSVVTPFTPTISTSAVTPVTIGSTISDTATVTGAPAPAAAPTGTVTFTLFGPANPTCTGQPIFTSSNRPLAGGPPPTATSTTFTPVVVGSYNWVAVYSGDGNYPTVTSPCGAPNEVSVVDQSVATIVTSALTPVTLGSAIRDTATVTGGPAPAPTPTGTVTFTLFGPANPTCTGAPIFTSSARPLGGGPPPTATSADFVPTATGSYNWVAVYSGDGAYPSVASPCGAPGEESVVTPGPVAIATTAVSPVTIGSPISDTATVTGAPAPAAAPTGTVTFTLFGPGNPTCTGAPIFAPAPVNLAGGPPPTANSGNFTPTAVGSYNWVAVYSGDGNYPSATSPCGAPNEVSVVNPASGLISTQAVANATVGTPISDTATVTGGPAPAPTPTGTVTFTLFGPGNPTCTGAPIFTSSARPLGGGPPPTATSADFVPTATGSYNWVAVYSGDAAYPGLTSPCGAPNETSAVTPAGPTIVTSAEGPVTLTQPIRDTATVTGAPAPAPTPTGSVTFTLFGPGNPTCTGAPIFTSAARPLAGGPPPTALSEDFTPTAAGSYNWVAVYSGDANNNAVTSPCGAPGETSVVTGLPTIEVAKTAVPLNRPEPGGDFTFNIVVTNTSAQVLTITSLTDDVYGDVTTRANSTCTAAIGTVLQPTPGPGNTYLCAFTAPFTGNAGDSQTDVVTVRATNPAGVEVTDNDDAVVTITGLLPQIHVDKVADPLTRNEPGGDFTYTIVVTNPGSLEAIRITSLTDDVYGDLSTRGTCTTAIGTVLAVNGGTYTCSFTAPFTGNGGDSLTDVVTVRGVDDDNTEVTDSDDATVRLIDILPIIAVDKTATPASRPEPGGSFTFNVVVTNLSNEPVTITSLTDNIYGNIATQGTCTTAVGTVLAAAPGPGNTYSCSFTGNFTGNAGASQIDIVRVTAVDNDGNSDNDSDDATVTITNVLPAILVEKSASPTSRPEPGGAFQFNVVVSNTGPEPLTITALTDNIHGNIANQGTCTTAVGTVLQPGGSYSCSFPSTFTGNAGASETDIVTVVGRDDDGSSVSDTDDATVTLTGVPPTVEITKTPTPASRPEPGGDFTFSFVVTNTSNEAVTITALTDDIYGNLNGKGSCATGAVLAPGAQYKCSFTVPFTGPPGATQRDVVTVRVVDDDGQAATDTDDAVITITDLVPAITVQKTANPIVRNEPGGTFTFDVVITNTGPIAVTITDLTDDIYGNLNGRGTCKVGAVLNANGGSYSCSFTGDFTGNAGASQTDVVTASAVDSGGSRTTSRDDAVVRLIDVAPTIILTKDADPTSRPDPGGSFTFRVAIQNTSFEPVTLVSLTDDVYGNLNGRGTCAINGVIQPGAFYRCEFTVDYRGPAGSSQVDRVFATVVDNDGTRANANDDARISITPVGTPPAVAPQQLTRTGTDVGGPARLAAALLLAGFLMLAATWRRSNRGLGFAGAAGRWTPPSTSSWFTGPPSGGGGGGGSRRSLRGAGLFGGSTPPTVAPEVTVVPEIEPPVDRPVDWLADGLDGDDPTDDPSDGLDPDDPDPGGGGGGGGGWTPPSGGGSAGGSSGGAALSLDPPREAAIHVTAELIAPAESESERALLRGADDLTVTVMLAGAAHNRVPPSARALRSARRFPI